MSLRSLPEPRALQRPANFNWDAPSDAMTRWAERQMAADDSAANVITIYDVIGEDWWTGGGFTAKRASAALRSIGNQDVVVNINSPGGDMFEGIAIYNLLREHKAKVTVNVMGLAASAASVIAMAGDNIRMGLGSFVMIHNAWGAVKGNQHDFRYATEQFVQFDGAMADIYEARTGLKRSEIERMMNAGSGNGTYMAPSEAVKNGFADEISSDLALPEPGEANAMDRGLMARRQIEAALARAGFSRGDRQQMIAALGGPRDATALPAARDAGVIEALKSLTATLKN